MNHRYICPSLIDSKRVLANISATRCLTVSNTLASTPYTIALVGHIAEQAGSKPAALNGLHRSHFIDTLDLGSSSGIPNGHAYRQAIQPIQRLSSTYTAPYLSRVIAPVGQTSIHGAFLQCRQDTGISKPMLVLYSLMNDTPSCMKSQTASQEPQPIHLPRSIILRYLG